MSLFNWFHGDKLAEIIERLDNIMVTQAQHAANLATNLAQLAKAKTEIVDKIGAMTVALANALASGGNITPEVQAAGEDLDALAQHFDDIVPDPVPDPPLPPVTTGPVG